MKIFSANEIKASLRDKNSKELTEIALRLARLKKENKELLSYLLFHSDDPDSYKEELKLEAGDQLRQYNIHNLYIFKKQVRRTITLINRHMKYVASAEIDAELRIFYLTELALLKDVWKKSPIVRKIFSNQIKKIRSIIEKLHPDLQSDFERQVIRVEEVL